MFSDGEGLNLNCDHHRQAPYENLFANIDAGLGERFWVSGGGGGTGPHTAAGETFWNIRASRPLGPPKPYFGPSVIFVGVGGAFPKNAMQPGWYYEPILPNRLTPANLHISQLARRLALDASRGSSSKTR